MSLYPERFIPRQQLPLHYLDTSALSHEGRTRLFCGQIQAFHIRTAETGNSNEGEILIARDGWTGRLTAIEAFQNGVYALCKLYEWVKIEDLDGNYIKARRIASSNEEQGAKSDGAWWNRVRLGIKEHKVSEEHGRKMVARFGLCMKPPSDKIGAIKKPIQSQQPDATTAEQVQAPALQLSVKIQPTPAAISTAEELTSLIRAQYLEALYISRTSLAYFAKGPLAKARAVACSGQSAHLQSSDVIDSLRSSILSVPMGNKKHLETLIEILKEIPSGLSPEDQESMMEMEGPIRDRLRNAKKRKKTTKGGLYVGEEEYIVRWWLFREANRESVGLDDTRNGRIKAALVEQRVRETLLQIILILEVIALEASQPSSPQEPTANSEGSKWQPPITPAKYPMKKQQNLSKTLDILIDRLCIWESMNVESSKVSTSTDTSHAQANPDRLRDFCTSVVVPFYATRLPDLYTSICTKLGALPSPPKPSSTRSNPNSKPGATTSRPIPPPLKKSHSTTTSISRRSLSRSTTDPNLGNLKREFTPAIDLSAIPAHIPWPRLPSQQRYEKREVDLAAVSQATEAKLARKARAEEELKGAIAALRRPNPRMAVREVVEDRERRVGMAGAGIGKRKGRKGEPVRNPFANPFGDREGVQVIATPKVRRWGDAVGIGGGGGAGGSMGLEMGGRGGTQLSQLYTQHLEPEVIPPSSDPRVPSSSFKPLAPPGTIGATPSRSATSQTRLFPPSRRSAIDASPSRRRTSGSNPGSLAAVLEAQDGTDTEGEPELPVMKPPSHSVRPKGLLKSKSFAGDMSTPSKRQKTLTFAVNTPSKGVIMVPGSDLGAVEQMEAETKTISRGVAAEESEMTGDQVREEGEEKDIYATLGWDEYDDLL